MANHRYMVSDIEPLFADSPAYRHALRATHYDAMARAREGAIRQIPSPSRL